VLIDRESHARFASRPHIFSHEHEESLVCLDATRSAAFVVALAD
jgi:hypothetical protein